MDKPEEEIISNATENPEPEVQGNIEPAAKEPIEPVKEIIETIPEETSVEVSEGISIKPAIETIANVQTPTPESIIEPALEAGSVKKPKKVEIDNTGGQNDQQIDLVTVSGVEFTSFENEEHVFGPSKKNLDIMQDVSMKITVELGRTKSSVKKVLEMSKGSIVELNKVAGEPVELFVNGKLVAYGEVIVMEEKFGLRVTNVAKSKSD